MVWDKWDRIDWLEPRRMPTHMPTHLGYRVMIYLSLDTAGSLEEVVRARTLESKQRVYLYRI